MSIGFIENSYFLRTLANNGVQAIVSLSGTRDDLKISDCVIHNFLKKVAFEINLTKYRKIN